MLISQEMHVKVNVDISRVKSVAGRAVYRLSEDLGRDGSGLGGLSVSGEEKVALAGSDALKI